MNDLPAPRGFHEAIAAAFPDAGAWPASGDGGDAIGQVSQIGGGQGEVTLDVGRLDRLRADPDPGLAMAGQVGGQVKVRVGSTWLIATIRSLRLVPGSASSIVAAVDFLGEGEEERLTGRLFGFRRGVTRYPAPGADVFALRAGDVTEIYAASGRAAIEIGHVHPTQDVRAALYVDAMLGKHFALLGSTGTGKSTAAALILHRICALAPQGHIVMIDPHGEYGAAFGEAGALFDVSNLQMPYWLMNFEEHCEVFVTATGASRQVDADILAKCLLAAKAKSRAGQEIAKLTVDAPIPYMLSDLTQLIQLEMGKMDRAGDTAPYLRLKNKIDEVRADPRYGFMFSGMLAGDAMAGFVQRIFRLPGEGKPISIIDVSGVPNEITAVVVAVLSRMVFDFAIWSRGEAQRPILLVCEEAHRYVPADAQARGSVARILGRIAKEGRKYGVALGLVTQRPSDLAEGVLSQCGTIIAMRLNNDRDQAFVRAAMPEGARGFLDALPALRNREAIVCGEGVSIPIRVAFDTLDEGQRPASDDPVFSELWRHGGGEEQMIARTLQRWRAQGR
ncbi:ATP-binding protein [Sphingomonas endophytica]|uniref:ATP-binding protein n=1 Tax=Sphingomonas endophytica TaxID=869719 RepID=UPI0009F83F8B|nr:ATP-binding protein [Sphingomonas endophytica]